jgi:hypothetical protein
MMLGTHKGPQHRVRDGKFVEEWTEYGEFNLMKQLLLPTGPAPGIG